MKHRKKLLLAGAMGGAALLLRVLAQLLPAQVVESLYARGLYRGLAQVFLRLGGLVPFSIAEVGLVLLAVGLPVGLVVLGIRLLRRPEGRKALLASVGAWCAVVLGGVALAFMLTGGLNYYRLTFTQLSGLELRDSTVEELTALCQDLAVEATALSSQVARNETGEMVLSGDFWSTTAQAREAYRQLGDQYQGTLAPGTRCHAKPVGFSKLMSYSRITGVYTFFTFEANINLDTPHYSIPATVCHEMAHACGFMREDEANYIAYLTASSSVDPELRYSGVTLALSHSLNALSTAADADTYSQVCGLIGRQVWRDFEVNNAYWDRYETKYGEFAESVNDTYLKANDQQDGAKSYGRMVDLLLAQHRLKAAA